MSDPISPEFRDVMNATAHLLDRLFNGDKTGEDRENFFVLLAGPFAKEGGTEQGRTNYISNGNRAEVVAVMKEIVARFEEEDQ